MTRDEVDSAAREVRDFWFGLTSEQQFAKDDALDAAIRARFATLRERVLASGAAAWRGDVQVLLAAVIVLDQFSRNLYRGEAEAFAADPLARDLTELAIGRG